jgi:hypothetical protein
MSDEDDDLEDYWSDLQKKQIIQVVSGRASDLKSQLEMASAKTAFDMTPMLAEYANRPLDSETLSKMITKTVETFMLKWYEGLRGQNLSGLIELVLEGQDLSVEELRGFMRALPVTLLRRILDSAIGATGTSGTGIHALMAVEMHLRQRGIPDYTLTRIGGRLHIEFTDPKRDALISFFLDEMHEHDDSSPDRPGADRLNATLGR